MKQLKKFVKTLSTIGLTGVVIGILVLINYIISFFPLRLDLTENKIYSLSPATQEILGKLSDIVTIKLFFSKELPNRLLPTRQEVENLLAEYERVGGKNLQVKLIVPDDLSKQQQAAALGIPRLQFSGIEKDKLQVSQGFFGAAVFFGGKSEAIPVFEEGGNFEYLFTAAINKLTRKKIPRVAFSRGHGEQVDKFGMARRLLERDFTVTTQTMPGAGNGTAPTIASDLQALLIVGPTQSWSKAEKEALTAFIAKGGAVLLALEGVGVDANLAANKLEHNLADFLKQYGLALKHNLIVSASNEIANFRTRQNIFLTPYPFWVRIRPEGFNQDFAATARLQTAVFPWVASLDLIGGKSDKKGKIIPLIYTVEQSYAQEGNFNLQPNQEFNLQTGTGKKLIAAAEITALTGDHKKRGKLVLIGDADFVTDNFIQRYQANAALFSNLVEWLASKSDLSGIRAHGTSFRPLVKLNDTAKAGVKYGNVLIAPFILGILGGIRLLRRK